MATLFRMIVFGISCTLANSQLIPCLEFPCDTSQEMNTLRLEPIENLIFSIEVIIQLEIHIEPTIDAILTANTQLNHRLNLFIALGRFSPTATSKIVVGIDAPFRINMHI